ncbi:ThuA domain-containing protein [Arthrobacter sp. ISL-69]|uniref:ThuA domain-containing protein n=1 Tax=Arthrobacter sp. ISL-69 TaxID=2819113 RepID=UPI001BE6A837|nr:ThuA domain-containing protein [Arthrobacter sp. ISL-69]MBT2538486.1 ThuA domain-containing protein [Arthrobacter sp. ISL-69]
MTRWLDSNRPLLVSHSSSRAFLTCRPGKKLWGGRWVRGTSMHPEYGPASIAVKSGPIVQGIPNFEVMDERYSYLRTSPCIRVRAHHNYEGQEHPVLWSLERPSAGGRTGRTFYDALGHDAASYESPEHRELLLRAIDWLTAV